MKELYADSMHFLKGIITSTHLLKVMAFTVILSSAAGSVSASTTIAFGYLRNESGDKNYNYLETIFPNSFATSTAALGMQVMKPHAVDTHLNATCNMRLKKKYELAELPGLVEHLNADLFIYGSFMPRPADRIKLVLHLYFRESREVLIITTIGRLETEIFRLVDRISIIMNNILNKFYKVQRIPAGSHLAILTNVDGLDVNKLYYAFLKQGYPVVCVQSTDLSTPLLEERFHKFRRITTDKNSYTVTNNWRLMKFHHGTWTGITYNQRIRYLKRIYTTYDGDYLTTKNRVLDTFSTTFRGIIDYILIIGFDESHDKAWVRCINMKKRDLIWIQWGIESEFLTDDAVLSIVHQIISTMSMKSDTPAK